MLFCLGLILCTWMCRFGVVFGYCYTLLCSPLNVCAQLRLRIVISVLSGMDGDEVIAPHPVSNLNRLGYDDFAARNELDPSQFGLSLGLSNPGPMHPVPVPPPSWFRDNMR